MNWLKHKALNALASDNNFDCNKMKLLIEEKSTLSFNERFSNWITANTKEAKNKIWRDIEYSQFG